MNVGGSFTVGRIAGIPIRVHFSWIFILVLLVWSLGADVFPAAYHHWSQPVYWITAVVASLLFFISILVHELCHSFVARRRGIPVSSITLFIFGGVSQIEQDARNPGTEFAIAIVGPLASIAIGIVCLALTPLGALVSKPVEATLAYLATINVLVGLFNLLPGFPLDGGRVLRSAIWKRTRSLAGATTAAVGVSELIALTMIVVGIFLTFATGSFSGLWLAFIGWFLSQSAATAGRQPVAQALFDGVTVRDVMRNDFESVRPALPVEQLVEEHMLHGHQRGFPVVGGGQLWGIITLADVARLPRARWAETPVEQVMTPRQRLKVAHAADTLAQVMSEFQRDGVKQLIVLPSEGESETPVGIVSREDVMDFINLRRLIGPQPA